MNPDPDELDTHALADQWNMTEAEVQYALEYADTLAVGDVEPSTEGLDPDRLYTIRQALRHAWWLKTRKITQQRRHR